MMFCVLLVICIPFTYGSSLLIPPASNATLIAHPSSGIFIQYIGEYIPSDFITNVSIIIPLTSAYCNIFPLIMAKNIPQCAHLFYSTSHRRYSRLAEGWIALGVAAAGTALATANRIAIASMETRLDNLATEVARSQYNVNVNTARIAHLHDGVMKLGNELRATQQSLFEYEQRDYQQNQSIFSINNSINALGYNVNNLEHKIRNIFLTQALNDIYQGRSTLSMLDPEDVSLLIPSLFNEMDEKSRQLFHHLPITQIITQLLIAQHFTFVLPNAYQTNDTHEIGRLIFTFFFGIPRPNMSYSIYEVKSVPYFVNNSFIRVIELPVFVGQCIDDGTFLEFYAEDTKMCLFTNWTTCKDQPPILKTIVNPCLREILTQNTTSLCIITKLPTSNFFIHQLTGSYWLVSFNESRDCIRAPLQLDTDTSAHPKLSVNNVRVRLPPVALISVLPMTTIICEGFSLVGRRLLNKNNNVIFISNGTMHRADIDIFNIQIKIHENWNSKQFNSKSIDAVLEFIGQTPSPPPLPTLYFPSINSIWQITTIILVIVLIIIVVVIIVYFRRNSITVCRRFNDKLNNRATVEIDLQQLDRYSADRLKKYYELIRQQKY